MLKKKRDETSNKENVKWKPDKTFRSKRKDIANSAETGKTKKEYQVKYLTINALVNHPYFGNTASEIDVSTIIEEFEKFQS